ncbi:MAG: DDE-type integrase/transposase/recombinase [Thiotrichales bacterium]|nr:DDE-type integrase/transposase/recombinase [Thiotrichales bacterium]
MADAGMLKLTPGESVTYEGEEYFIKQVADLTHIVLIHPTTKKLKEVAISDLGIVNSGDAKKTPDLALIADAKWDEAIKRFNIIKPLLVNGRTRAMVTARANEYGFSTNSLYGWIRKYETTGKVTDLLTDQRADKGESKLTQELQDLINDVIKTEYKTKQKKSLTKVHRELRIRCKDLGLKAPHYNTLRAWIKKEHPKEIERLREGNKKAAEKYSPIRGAFPGADWPFSYVQVDHTRMDIQLCDDYWRKPVGRPWITVVFDVFSRMVLGFRVGFDDPSGLVTGLAITHAALPKEDWLAKYNVNGEWPCWGISWGAVHMDNAREFRGKLIQRACDQYGINVEWRPVARPQYGAHIERYLGTLAEELKGVSGATFSNIQEKGTYDSEGNAVFTLSDLEEWLTVQIVGMYHNSIHSALGMSPLDKFRQGILGDDQQPGIGLPARIHDVRRFRLDFLPFMERTVQRVGVSIDEIVYFADVLRRWVNAPDPESPKHKRKFIFRRDPRDISTIWFFDPEDNEYYPIPYRNASHPAVSIWEWKATQSRLKEEREGRQNEDEIFATVKRMREIEERAARDTKKARRTFERKKVVSMPPVKSKEKKVTQVDVQKERLDSEPKKVIKPFEDLDEML